MPYPLYLGGQTYIDNGAEDLREMFQPYLIDFDPNAPHEVMFCPANIRHSKEVGFERVREQWRKHNIYYMGYAYWGLGKTCIPSSREYVSGWDWVSNRLPPERSSDNGRTCLFSDPTERFLVSETWWGLACHTVKGTEIWSDLPPEGMNNARLDGSVDWRICEDYIDSWNPSISIDWGPKLEVCMEYKGRVYLWGKRSERLSMSPANWHRSLNTMANFGLS